MLVCVTNVSLVSLACTSTHQEACKQVAPTSIKNLNAPELSLLQY